MTIMRSIPLWILAIGALLFVIFYGVRTLGSPEIGRYQLGQGVITGYDDRKEPALVKIDTVSGKTWRLNINLIESKASPGGVLTTPDGQPVSIAQWNEID